jgi:hypothetical protein
VLCHAVSMSTTIIPTPELLRADILARVAELRALRRLLRLAVAAQAAREARTARKRPYTAGEEARYAE